MNLLIADTRKDVGRGHQSRISALHSALGGHIVEMDDSVPCGIRLDGELICSGLEYALIRPEVVRLRPMPEDMFGDAYFRNRVANGEILAYPRDAGKGWLYKLSRAGGYVGPPGVSALEACCLGVPTLTLYGGDETHQAVQIAIEDLNDAFTRFQVIDGQGATRVKQKIREALGIPEDQRFS